jgi:hypothetical protein
MKLLFLITFWLWTPVVGRNLITFQIHNLNPRKKLDCESWMNFKQHHSYIGRSFESDGQTAPRHWRDSVPFMVKAATFYAFAQPHPSSPNKWWARWVIYFDWPLSTRRRPLAFVSSFASHWNNCLRWLDAESIFMDALMEIINFCHDLAPAQSSSGQIRRRP